MWPGAACAVHARSALRPPAAQSRVEPNRSTGRPRSALARRCTIMVQMPTPPDLPPELDALATPIAWLDADGRLRQCNLAFARWLGVSARRLQGRPLGELDAEGDRL